MLDSIKICQNTTNHKRTDKITAKLKPSRINISSLTNNNSNVYFGAVFAMGLKIPSIMDLSKWHADNLSFYTGHYQHLDGKDAKDLRMKICSIVRSFS